MSTRDVTYTTLRATLLALVARIAQVAVAPRSFDDARNANERDEPHVT